MITAVFVYNMGAKFSLNLAPCTPPTLLGVFYGFPMEYVRICFGLKPETFGKRKSPDLSKKGKTGPRALQIKFFIEIAVRDDNLSITRYFIKID